MRNYTSHGKLNCYCIQCRSNMLTFSDHSLQPSSTIIDDSGRGVNRQRNEANTHVFYSKEPGGPTACSKHWEKAGRGSPSGFSGRKGYGRHSFLRLFLAQSPEQRITGAYGLAQLHELCFTISSAYQSLYSNNRVILLLLDVEGS